MSQEPPRGKQSERTLEPEQRRNASARRGVRPEAPFEERQLFHSEKLASLGLLASGAAHEINNPNGFITFNLPILRNYVSAVLSHITRGHGLRDEKSWFGMSFEAFCADLFQFVNGCCPGR